ncbi:hypothetical protein BN159_p50 (plasmid) [Streptomyces davaonensis JCM 4913]|uniref:Uncharacterized protein n=1 Tax=Streptomyces davaonensis (strain DSM 101723 / JCM 4913 / KCC S-0913 / 768) TaxID=1214101 RepID=K4RG84_STRDJ|nr:RRQRL motif-containing zinc-binding protein [Streptomyces davaonensis]CCK32928.1 hypothetical protein BN159_p50 [Streptomyces davaonensis JCM 4913]
MDRPDEADPVDVDVYDDGSFPVYGFLQAPNAAAVLAAVRGEGPIPETGLATRRQLRALGLSPGGQEAIAALTWHGGLRTAWFYRIELAVPKRVPTLAQEAALDKAMAARQTCPKCRRRYFHCLRLRTVGSCEECFDGTPADPASYIPPASPKAA